MSDLQTKVVQNSDGSITFATTQDASSILAQNEYEANNNLNRTNKDTFGRKVASIPLGVINQWCQEWNCTFQQLMADPMMKAKMMARLRDRSWLKLRTDHGKI